MTVLVIARSTVTLRVASTVRMTVTVLVTEEILDYKYSDFR